MQLHGLPDTRKVRACRFIRRANQAVDNLRRKMASTAAGSRGAINVWNDKFGHYRCERCVFLRVAESATFTNLKAVRVWVAKNLKVIHGN